MKNEDVDIENSNPVAPRASKQTPKNERLLKIISDGTPEMLEAEVRSSRKFLEDLKAPMASFVDQHRDAKHWVQQIGMLCVCNIQTWLTWIDALLKQEVDTPTIIGVVGNTGAGKSSVINAMLEEERLVPTNCMRACTAVVTEMSWNSSKLAHEKYRADIEFISAAEWRKDLELSLSELIDANGQVSRDCNNPDSEAGIAYAKVKSGMSIFTSLRMLQSNIYISLFSKNQRSACSLQCRWSNERAWSEGYSRKHKEDCCW